MYHNVETVILKLTFGERREYLHGSNIFSTVKMLNFYKTHKQWDPRFVINYAQNPRYLGEEERFIQVAFLKM